MNAFRFSLDKVLAWRRTELDLEEVKFKRQLAALADLDRERAALEAAGVRAEIDTRNFNPLAGGDLAGLANFRLHVQVAEKRIASRRVECQRQLAAQQSAMLEARRRCRLLERLKERRHAEWQAACDRELEELASESFLAQFARRQRQRQG